MTLIASDTFTRANSTTSLGNADTGQPWSIAPLSPGGALWGIDSGKAYVPAPSMASFVDYSGVPKNIAVVGAGIDTHDVSADITLSATSPSVGVVAKYVDENNFVMAIIYNTTSYGIQPVVSYLGGFTFPALATPTVTKGATYTLRVEVTATDINVYRDGTPVTTTTLTAPQQAMFAAPAAAGLYLGSGTLGSGPFTNDPGDSRFDNFTFDATPVPKRGFRNVGLSRGARSVT